MRTTLLRFFLLVCFFSSHALADSLIPLEATFSPNSKKTGGRVLDFGGLKEEVGPKEEGEKEGVKYRFYHEDGSGTFSGDGRNDFSSANYKNNWDLRCKKDIMDDEVWCSASKGVFAVFLAKDAGFLVALLGSKYPGSKISVRVDGGEVIAADEKPGFNLQQSRKVLSSIQDGSKVATRYVDWPYKVNKDEVLSVYGLKQVMDYMLWVQKVAQ